MLYWVWDDNGKRRSWDSDQAICDEKEAGLEPPAAVPGERSPSNQSNSSVLTLQPWRRIDQNFSWLTFKVYGRLLDIVYHSPFNTLGARVYRYQIHIQYDPHNKCMQYSVGDHPRWYPFDSKPCASLKSRFNITIPSRLSKGLYTLRRFRLSSLHPLCLLDSVFLSWIRAPSRQW